MGLDMYLYRKTYLNNSDIYKEEYRHKVKFESAPKATQINSEKVKYVIEEIAYWRKANHIHNWFVQNIQNGVDDCGYYRVTKDQLNELYALCKSVVNKDVSTESLPTRRGFFFGSTDYDEYYFSDCQETIDMLKPHIEDNSNEFIYTSSW